MSDTNRHSSHGYVAALLVTLISVAVTFFLVINRQSIIDHVYVWQYEPTSEISAFIERTGMNARGEFLFYASQPTLEGTQVFNEKCARLEQATAILGCYDGRTIYIYDVPNPRLDGIREVTAAHEMLHAAYQRLGASDKQRIDALLDVEYKKLQDDSEFAERMAFYARTEPGQRNNELHSIIATEVADISPDLEEYYRMYFDDRSKTVALHTQYASIFATLQARGQELSRQLTALADTIDQKSAQYNRDVDALNQSIEQFNTRANGDGFSSQQQFNAERSQLINRANQLDAFRAAINNDRSTYNAIREELVTVAGESEALNRSIDSSLAPAPSL